MADLSVFVLMKKTAYVFHIDVNSAFLSWSAAYAVHILGKQQADLRTLPSIVGGDPKTRHGIVLAKSIPAKKYQIQTGEALFTARRKCPNLIVIPPDYGLYVRASRALIQKLKQYSEQVIQYSIDEAWVVLEGMESLYGKGQMVNLAFQLKQEISDELGFTVNIGVSTNFLLSKMASEFSKPDQVHTLFPDEISKKMWPLPVGKLFFVGKATAGKLHRLGIHTIGELACMDKAIMKAYLKLPGELIWKYANGGDLEPYLFLHSGNKGYGNSMTAPFDIRTAASARQLLLSLSETVGARLRFDRVKIRMVSLHITTCDFQCTEKQMQLLTATDITEEIYQAACTLFEKLWDRQTPLRQIGIHTSKAESGAGRQYQLFEQEKLDKLELLNQTVDTVRQKYGEDSLMRACFLNNPLPHMGGGLDKERRSGVTIGIDMEHEKVRSI